MSMLFKGNFHTQYKAQFDECDLLTFCEFYGWNLFIKEL